jgi:hypothetical protein
MKVVMPLLVSSNLVVASAAVAIDAIETLREQLTSCGQFVIHDPDSRIVLNHMRDCCAFSQNNRDCQMYNLGTAERP